MRVKVNDKWYDAENNMIMVELTNEDKENIRNMLHSATRYCLYPDHIDPKTVRLWMNE